MFDFFAEFCMWLWSFLDMASMVGGLFALVGLIWLMLSPEGQRFLEWFSDSFME